MSPIWSSIAWVPAITSPKACDAASRSELVVPLHGRDGVIGVIDLDSPSPARFDADDQAGIERIAAIWLAACGEGAQAALAKAS